MSDSVNGELIERLEGQLQQLGQEYELLREVVAGVKRELDSVPDRAIEEHKGGGQLLLKVELASDRVLAVLNSIFCACSPFRLGEKQLKEGEA